MAKVKIKGYNELIEVNDKVARTIKEKLFDDSVPKNAVLDLERLAVEKNNVVAVFLDERQRDQGQVYKNQIEEYYKKRNGLLALSPRERAEKTSWGYFKLVYWGIYEKLPSDDYKEKVFKKVTEFFESNSEWSKPSIRCFMDLLEKDKHTGINGFVTGVIERVEMRELRDIKGEEEYYRQDLNLEKQEEEAFRDIEKLGGQDEIKAEDIPF